MTSLPINSLPQIHSEEPHNTFLSVFINFNLFYPNDDIRIQTCIKLQQNNRLYFSKPVDSLLLVEICRSLIIILSELLDKCRD